MLLAQELREFLEHWGGLSFLPPSLLLHKPRSPVEERELSTDCLHKPTVCPSHDSARMLSYQELPTSIQVW